MKKVFQNTSEVVHVFAQQSQSQGCNQSRSIYFYDNKIYSYGSHYLLGEFINDETIIINDFGYSVTTSKHINELTNATSQYNQFLTSSIDIKHIQTEPSPIFPNKEVKITWFGETLTLKGGEQIFAAKAVLQAIFNIKQDDLK